MNNPNKIGIIGQVKTMLDLYENNFSCFLPHDDFSPIDLIAVNKSGKTYRIQVKSRSPLKKTRSYQLQASSVINGKRIPIDKSMIDLWAIYLNDIDRMVYVDVERFGKNKSINITQVMLETEDLSLARYK